MAEAAQTREREQRDRYHRDDPTEQSRALLALIEDHLAAGADPERIASFVAAATRPVVCDNAPRTKRFLVRTRSMRVPTTP